MTQYASLQAPTLGPVLVKGITINCELRLVLNHLWVSESAINYDAVHQTTQEDSTDSRGTFLSV